jgi:hypothetical protein
LPRTGSLGHQPARCRFIQYRDLLQALDGPGREHSRGSICQAHPVAALEHYQRAGNRVEQCLQVLNLRLPPGARELDG